MKFITILASVLFLSGCQTIREITPVDTNQQNTVIEQPTNTPVVPAVPAVPAVPVIKETPQQQKNLWNRIAMQITTKIPNNKRVQYYRNWYLANPLNLEIIAQRAQPFLYYITEQIEKRGMPLELALLPIVESSYDSNAYSDMNAAGLWQFMPATGRHFGLTQNRWYDGRRDVMKSTNAALDYLEYLDKTFDGHWKQALAAYNSGEGRVFSAIRQNSAEGKPTDYWDLNLPQETSSYVPKLYAVADIIMHPKKYGFYIPAISNKPVVAEVDPGVQMDLSVAAEFAGISLSELEDLNPQYRRGVTAPNGLDSLLLPINTIDRFKRELAQNRNASIITHHYRVKAGDSLGLIALRYHSSIQAIQRANNLRTTRIRIGELLTIPTSPITLVNRAAINVEAQRREEINAENQRREDINAENQRRADINAEDQHREEISAEDQRLANINAEDLYHADINTEAQHYVVKSGDSLWSIAHQYNTNVNQLKQLNHLNKNAVLHLGQILTIPTSPITLVSRQHRTDINIEAQHYVVQSGDSLWSIAHQYNTNVNQLKQLNHLNENAVLHQGQILTISRAAATPKKLARYKTISYKIRSGDSLSVIAQRYNVSVAEIKKWNHISNSRYIKQGQQLKLVIDNRQGKA